jgi:hypothetical protein
MSFPAEFSSEAHKVWQSQNQNSSSRRLPWDISKLVFFEPLHLLPFPYSCHVVTLCFVVYKMYILFRSSAGGGHY